MGGNHQPQMEIYITNTDNGFFWGGWVDYFHKKNMGNSTQSRADSRRIRDLKYSFLTDKLMFSID